MRDTRYGSYLKVGIYRYQTEALSKSQHKRDEKFGEKKKDFQLFGEEKKMKKDECKEWEKVEARSFRMDIHCHYLKMTHTPRSPRLIRIAPFPLRLITLI